MNGKRYGMWKRWILLLMALAILLTPLLSNAEPGKDSFVRVTPVRNVRIETADPAAKDSIVLRVFTNMVDQALNRDLQAGDGEWEDPSLKEYPLDPHELEEYGDSPRVRFLNEEEEPAVRTDDPESAPEAEKKPDYLVYRESIYLIPADRASAYTLSESEDGRSATLSPAIPAEELEGKTGIALLGENILLDRVLVFDRALETAEGRTVLSLADPDELRLNQLFSDGHMSTVIEDTSRTLPKMATAGVSDAGPGLRAGIGDIEDLVGRIFILGGDNWEAKFSNIRPSDLGLDFEVDVWKLQFGIKLTLGFKADFDITTTGSTDGKTEEDMIVNIPVDLGYGFSTGVEFDFRAKFDDTPIHTTGTMHNQLSLVVGTTGTTVEDYVTDVEYKTFDVGDGEGHWYREDVNANTDIDFYIGTEMSVSVAWGSVGINLWLAKITFGPLAELSLNYESGSDAHAVWEQDRLDPEQVTREEESLHSCLEMGKEGCVCLVSEETANWNISFKLDLYFKSWKWELVTGDPEETGSRQYYMSRTFHEGRLTEGICPHYYYRVPVEVWNNRNEFIHSGVPDMVVDVENRPENVDDVLWQFTWDITDEAGQAAVYLPYRKEFKYHIAARGQMEAEGYSIDVEGDAFQPTDMKRAGNDTVVIIVQSVDKIDVEVEKHWDIDADGLDKPRSVQVSVEYYNTTGYSWNILEISQSGLRYAIETLREDQEHEENNWRCVISVPKYLFQGTSLEGHRGVYRVRELAWEERAIPTPGGDNERSFLEDYTLYNRYDGDYTDPEKPPEAESKPIHTVVRGVDAYITRLGTIVPEHETKYLVSYAEDWYENEEGREVHRFRITDKAAYDIKMYKRWVGIPEAERPDHVYLVLMGQPQEGWTDVVETHNVHDALLPVIGPLAGETVTLAQIAAQGELSVQVPRILERDIAIARVDKGADTNGDGEDENIWSSDFMVPKYLQGIPLDYIAAELDAGIIHDMILREYEVDAPVVMPHPDNYISIPGKAMPIYFNYELTASVINARPDVEVDLDPEKHTIGGVKYWRPNYADPSFPEYVKIHIREKGASTELPCSPVTVNKPATNIFSPNFERWMWPWTVYDPEIDVSKEYEIWEEMPGDYAKWYFAQVDGMNILNTWVGNATPRIRVEKVWDSEYKPYQGQWPNVDFRIVIGGSGGGARIEAEGRLTQGNHYIYEGELGVTLSANFELISLEEKTTVRDENGVECVPITDGPVLVFDNNVPVYQFYLGNMLQRNPIFNICKNWDFPAGMGMSAKMPETLTFRIRRDGEIVWEGTREAFKNWGDAAIGPHPNDEYIARDRNNEPFLRVDPATGRPYIYTLEEVSYPGMITEENPLEEGFLPVYSSYTQKVDGVGTVTFLEVRNEWIDADSIRYVTVTGHKTWDDINGENLRPEKIRVSIVNGYDEFVRSVEVEPNQNGVWSWSVSRLPRYREDGELLHYYVIESVVDGYTAEYSMDFNSATQTWSTYDAEQGTWTNFDPDTRTWECDITNSLTGHFPLKIKKVVEGDAPEGSETEEFTFTVESRENLNPDVEVTFPDPIESEVKIQGQGEAQFDFLFNEEGLYLYNVQEVKGSTESCEYDDDFREVLIAVVRDETGKLTFKPYVDVGKAADDEDGTVEHEQVKPLFDRTEVDPKDPIVFTNKYLSPITIKKEWDIDAEGKDRPDRIEAVIQEKKEKDGKETWENVAVVELTKDNDWTVEKQVPRTRTKDGESKPTAIDYRVRELKEKTKLDQLMEAIREPIQQGKEKYDEWFNQLKTEGKEFFDLLPGVIRNSANQGYDQLLETLKATPDNLYEKLMEKLTLTTVADRIVYDKDDKDNPKKDDKAETNRVTFHVEEYDSTLTGEKEDAHDTKYKVGYKKDDDTYTITNQAILEIDVVKRWLEIGDADDDDRPDSVWLALMFKLNPEILEKAGEAASSLTEYTDIELPVFNLLNNALFDSGLISGGTNPITMISEMALGFDIDIFDIGDKLLKVAITEVDDDDDWKTSYVVTKYMMGVPVEFRGAELTSEIIRLLLKYILQFDSPVSYTPFGNYISIPGKAYGNLLDTHMAADLFDVDKSTFTGKIAAAAIEFALDKVNDLIRDIVPDGVPIGLDDWEQVSNVINVLFDFEINEPISGRKIWVNDENTGNTGNDGNTGSTGENGAGENGTGDGGTTGDGGEGEAAEKPIRPEYLTIIVKQGEKEVYREKISEENDWSWSFDPSENEDEDDDEDDDDDGDDEEYTVYEEYPTGYPEEKINRYHMTRNGYDLINTWDNISVAGTKTWVDEDDRDGMRPEKITIRLLADGVPMTREVEQTDEETGETVTVTEEVTVETSANGGWKYHFLNLPEYTEGENGERKKITYSVEEVEVPKGYVAAVSGYDITNTHEPEILGEVTIRKEWDDGDDQDRIRPESVFMFLRANGATPTDLSPAEAEPVELSEENGWEYTYHNLHQFEDGREIEYTADEPEEPEGYEKKIEGLTVTNVHAPEVLDEVTVKKIWDDDDDRDGIRPESVFMVLRANGATPTDLSPAEAEPVELSAENNWEHTYQNLHKYEGGKEIKYTADEPEVPEGYEKEIEGLTVTNIHKPELLEEVTVKKAWDDADDLDEIRPESVTVKLLANGGEAETADEKHPATPTDLSAANGWEYTYQNLYKYADGEEIEYTADEEPVPAGYKKSIDGLTVTNIHKPVRKYVSGKKTWVNDSEEDRPAYLTIIAMLEGREVYRTEISVENGWSWSFAPWELEADGGNGDGDYTILEEFPADYPAEKQAHYSAVSSGHDLINTWDNVSVAGIKTWDDDDDRDGLRPEKITIRLLADGKPVTREAEQTDGETGETITVTEEVTAETSAAEEWKYQFLNLPKTREGADGEPEEIAYSVEETEVPKGYTASVSGYDITNAHTPELLDKVTVKKAWDDDDDRDGIRPESVTVKLLANGGAPEAADEEHPVEPAELSAANGWEYTYQNLYKYKDGEEIVYTADEDDVPEGYIKETDGLTVTNIHTPETVTKSGGKTWAGDGDNPKLRPESITIRLLADGTETDSVTVTAGDGWKWEFTGLPRYDRGEEITYTVREDEVDWYLAETDGMDVTNTQAVRSYRVEFYYQADGVYPDKPDETIERKGTAGRTASVTDEDLGRAADRYELDPDAGNVLEGVPDEDGTLVLKLYFRPYYIITFDPNGGTLDGSTAPVTSRHFWGERITIMRAPVRSGYSFLYWRGSSYQPGDEYTVTEDHVFTAQWESDNPYTYQFTFTKKWPGDSEDSIDWTLYYPDGTVAHKRFNKKVVSEKEWRYEAWFPTVTDYYIVENVPAGYKVRYENVGAHAGETDRCYNGGTIINYKVPKTGDTAPVLVWAFSALAGLAGLIAAAAAVRKRRRTGK